MTGTVTWFELSSAAYRSATVPTEPTGVAAVRDVGRPGVVLALEVVERGEVPWQEARLGVPDRALHAALGLRIRGAQDDRAGVEGTQEPGDVVVQASP